MLIISWIALLMIYQSSVYVNIVEQMKEDSMPGFEINLNLKRKLTQNRRKIKDR